MCRMVSIRSRLLIGHNHNLKNCHFPNLCADTLSTVFHGLYNKVGFYKQYPGM